MAVQSENVRAMAQKTHSFHVCCSQDGFVCREVVKSLLADDPVRNTDALLPCVVVSLLKCYL